MRRLAAVMAFVGLAAVIAAAVAGAVAGALTSDVLTALLIVALLVIAPLAVATMLRERRLREVEELRAELDRRERVLEMVLDTVSSGIVALDAEGRIEIANEAACRMLGLPRSARPERWPSAARFRDPEGAEEAGVSPVWAMLTGKRIRGADYVLDVEGREPLRLRVNAEPAPLGAPIGAVMTLEDVTEQHRARVLGDRADRLDALGKLTGGVAHDFNNLLSTIMGALQLAERRSQGDPRIARHLDAALRATRTGAELVDRLLGFAKRGAAALEDVCLDALFAEAESLAKNAVDPSIRLTFAPPPAGWAVRCDRAQIVTAILNLVANARDAIAADRGAGAIVISARESAERADCCEIVVADDGPGMSADVRARALDPFFTTKGAARGTGLGLSMVYGALRRCGGDLRIESEPGRGAVIRMLTPKARAAAAPAPAPRPRAARDGAGRAVLLVEDEPDLLDTAEAMLVDLGYAVIRAGDGPSALKELALGRVVDVLVSDVMMPGGMSGVELAERARAMRPDLPVILASGYAEGAAEGGRRLGATLVRKPYSIDDLSAALRGVVERRGRTGVAKAG
ncbi:MAG: PAS domain-containing hybrid sensor histidine kinase/response regulator [Rhodobacteraceae bacterium]|nr:MAG: PAS domain-containing hybrid sensor histidine kinase/response regulator [Paracoccaceae bacterium]